MHIYIVTPPCILLILITGEKLETDPQWLSSHLDALDIYTEERIRSAIAMTPQAAGAEVVYAYETLETHGRCVSVATAAHVRSIYRVSPIYICMCVCICIYTCVYT